MNKIISFMLLDFRVARAWLVIGSLFSSFMLTAASLDDSVNVFMFRLIGFLSVAFIVQPLAIEEKNSLSTLHATLPLTRCDIVKAKYLFFLCAQAIIMIPSLLLTMLLKPLFSQNNETTYLFIAVTFLTAFFIASILYPLYFKMGYAKAVFVLGFSVIALLSFAAIIVLVIGLLGTFGDLLRSFSDFFFQNFLAKLAFLIPATPLGKAAAGLLLFCLSYLLSRRIYRTRDI